MSSPAARPPAALRRPPGTRTRVAFVGRDEWLQGSAPIGAAAPFMFNRFRVGGDGAAPLDELVPFAPHVIVVFDPASLPLEPLLSLPAITLGVLVGDASSAVSADNLGSLDRVVAFDPGMTGEAVGSGRVWRAMPPPVSDGFFVQDQRPNRASRVMTIGASTPHREAVLTPTKHRHDLLQVVHGVTGSRLAALLRQADVGVYVPRASGGGFGAQVGMHLAAGQLLLAESLRPAHGLERDIDYRHFDAPDELVWMLDRLGRFPEMYRRTRIRGRLKAEQFRASTLFRRIVGDLLLDVAAFGRRP